MTVIYSILCTNARKVIWTGVSSALPPKQGRLYLQCKSYAFSFWTYVFLYVHQFFNFFTMSTVNLSPLIWRFKSRMMHFIFRSCGYCKCWQKIAWRINDKSFELIFYLYLTVCLSRYLHILTLELHLVNQYYSGMNKNIERTRGGPTDVKLHPYMYKWIIIEIWYNSHETP